MKSTGRLLTCIANECHWLVLDCYWMVVGMPLECPSVMLLDCYWLLLECYWVDALTCIEKHWIAIQLIAIQSLLSC